MKKNEPLMALGIDAESYVRCLNHPCMVGARGGIMRELTKKSNGREKYRQYACDCGNIVEIKMDFTKQELAAHANKTWRSNACDGVPRR